MASASPVETEMGLGLSKCETIGYVSGTETAVESVSVAEDISTNVSAVGGVSAGEDVFSSVSVVKDTPSYAPVIEDLSDIEDVQPITPTMTDEEWRQLFASIPDFNFDEPNFGDRLPVDLEQILAVVEPESREPPLEEKQTTLFSPE